MPVSTGHVEMRTHVQDWTCVRILTGPVITDHWTEASPLLKILKIFNAPINHVTSHWVAEKISKSNG